MLLYEKLYPLIDDEYIRTVMGTMSNIPNAETDLPIYIEAEDGRALTEYLYTTTEKFSLVNNEDHGITIIWANGETEEHPASEKITVYLETEDWEYQIIPKPVDITSISVTNVGGPWEDGGAGVEAEYHDIEVQLTYANGDIKNINLGDDEWNLLAFLPEHGEVLESPVESPVTVKVYLIANPSVETTFEKEVVQVE